MVAAVEKMFYVGDVPWHGEGEAHDEALTFEQAMEAAGLNWEVSTSNVFDENGLLIPQYQSIVRSSDQRVLGITGKRYEPIQNRDALGFFEQLATDRVLKYETGGSLWNGSTVWLLGQMEKGMRIGDDEYQQYLLSTTTHDGTKSESHYATNVRVVCNNTLTLATNKRALATVRHRGDTFEQRARASQIVKLVDEQQERMRVWLDKLTTIKLTAEKAEQARDVMFGALDDATPTRRRNAIDEFKAIYDAEVERCGETAYALVNAITGYGDHRIQFKEGQRFASILSGRAATFKTDGLKLVGELAGVKL